MTLPEVQRGAWVRKGSEQRLKGGSVIRRAEHGFLLRDGRPQALGVLLRLQRVSHGPEKGRPDKTLSLVSRMRSAGWGARAQSRARNAYPCKATTGCAVQP